MQMRAFFLAFAMMLPSSIVVAQEQARTTPPIVFVDPRVVLEQSLSGQLVLEQNRAARAVLQAEADAISVAFEQEELEIAARRALLTREAFNQLATDFDRRVRAARADQDRKGQVIIAETEARERAFTDKLNPIYAEILSELGAAAVIDLRNVILANARLDISQEVIRRLDSGVDEAPVDPAQRAE